MSDKHLSGEEKRRLLKEEFKKELLLKKKFLDKVKGLRQENRINKALGGMTPTDDTDVWIEKLNSESAFLEAKTELALDSVREIPIDSPGDISNTAADQEIQKIVAEGLVEEMKKEMLEEKKIQQVHEFPLKADKEDPESVNGKPELPSPPRKTLGDMEH